MVCAWHRLSKALTSNVHTEVEEVVLSSKKWGLWWKQDPAL